MSKQLTAQVFAVMYTARVYENDIRLGPNSDEHNILDFLADRYPGLYRRVSGLSHVDYRQFVDGVFALHEQYFPQDFAQAA